ncbi:hypothetical protein [Leptothermofonsia sp. ETS-13]|uniref:hypothetical protein n=1 Tax=Leptothermofonsia sp. ETS-13 TaxID=3035696 RepID=UPI003B9F52F8
MGFVYFTNLCFLPRSTKIPLCPHPSPFTSLLTCYSSLPVISPTVGDSQSPITGTETGAADTAINPGNETISAPQSQGNGTNTNDGKHSSVASITPT